MLSTSMRDSSCFLSTVVNPSAHTYIGSLVNLYSGVEDDELVVIVNTAVDHLCLYTSGRLLIEGREEIVR